MGLYALDRRVSEIRTFNIFQIENMVLYRKLFIVPWNWAEQFPFYKEKGKSYNNTIAFAKGKKLPSVKKSFDVRGGIVYFTQGVNIERFSVNGKETNVEPS